VTQVQPTLFNNAEDDEYYQKKISNCMCMTLVQCVLKWFVAFWGWSFTPILYALWKTFLKLN